jgi:xylose isomerase
MRTYKILAAKARAFDADPRVRELLAAPRDPAAEGLLAGPYSAARREGLRQLAVDAEALGARGLRYERLDQLMVEHLMGVA